MHLRQREAERLQERARRELWVEGSVSRNELEKQIRNFLLRCSARGLLSALANPKCTIFEARVSSPRILAYLSLNICFKS